MNPLRSLAHYVGGAYVRAVTGREYERQLVRRNERPVDLRFIFEQLLWICPESVLDVGTGVSPLPAMLRNCGFHVTATDNVIDYWPSGLMNRHWYVLNDDITRTNLKGHFDVVICAGVLQHVTRHVDAVRCMFDVLSPGGYLIISCPYNEREYVPNAYDLPRAGYGKGNPYICQQHSGVHRDRWVRENHGKLVIQEHWRIFSGAYWTYGEVLKPPVRTSADEVHQFTCMLLRKPAGV